MITTKYIADKIKIFLNSIYYLDNLNSIKVDNKEFKSINILLNEVLNSEILCNYLKGSANIYNCLNNKKNGTLIEKEKNKENDKKININFFSFNQKNISTLSKFFNSYNEIKLIYNLIQNKIYNNIKYAFDQANINNSNKKENSNKDILYKYIKYTNKDNIFFSKIKKSNKIKILKNNKFKENKKINKSIIFKKNNLTVGKKTFEKRLIKSYNIINELSSSKNNNFTNSQKDIPYRRIILSDPKNKNKDRTENSRKKKIIIKTTIVVKNKI